MGICAWSFVKLTLKLEMKKETGTNIKTIYDRNVTALVTKGLSLAKCYLCYNLFKISTYSFCYPVPKRFFRYDNKNNSKRIVIRMSDYGIELLRELTNSLWWYILWMPWNIFSVLYYIWIKGWSYSTMWIHSNTE